MTSSRPVDPVSKPGSAPSKEDRRPQDLAVVHPPESLLSGVVGDRLGDEGVGVEAILQVPIDRSRDVSTR
jgi:hypothetical protein